jgi:hypothetical protein
VYVKFWYKKLAIGDEKSGFRSSPPPKSVGQVIYEYVDCSNKDTFFTTKLL